MIVSYFRWNLIEWLQFNFSSYLFCFFLLKHRSTYSNLLQNQFSWIHFLIMMIIYYRFIASLTWEPEYLQILFCLYVWKCFALINFIWLNSGFDLLTKLLDPNFLDFKLFCLNFSIKNSTLLEAVILIDLFWVRFLPSTTALYKY